MVLGVFAAALAGSNFRGHEVATIVGLGSSGLMASLLYLSIIFGKVTVSTLNAYGSFMCIATIISGWRSHLEITARQRMLFVLVIVAASTTLALLGQDSFLNTFKYFILFLLTFFTPWSAINLVDYYFINKGRYDLKALSDPRGRYGRWNVLGISVYVAGVLIQLPFVDSHFYSGPMVAQLGGVDISWIVGLVVPGILYYLLARTSVRAVPAVIPQ